MPPDAPSRDATYARNVDLGMNPTKVGKLDNADQEAWKLTLPAFIEQLYRKRFNKDRADVSCPSRNTLVSKKTAAKRESDPAAPRRRDMSEYPFGFHPGVSAASWGLWGLPRDSEPRAPLVALVFG